MSHDEALDEELAKGGFTMTGQDSSPQIFEEL